MVVDERRILPVREASFDNVGRHQVQVGILQHYTGVLPPQFHLERDHPGLLRYGDSGVSAGETTAGR